MKKLLLILLIVHFSLPIVNSQWVQQSVPVSKPITGIKFIDANTGWACTSLGTGGANYGYILHTTNGGTNWFIQDSSFNTNYKALCVINGNVIYCGGDTLGNGKLSKSTNGGLNWQYIGTPSAIDDMYFLNQDSGYYCADFIGADVRTTTDGGATWQVRISGIAAQTQRIFFLNYNTGFCGANSFLYKTTNAGLNWVQIANFLRDPTSMFFFNENTGWVGATISTFYKTTNGGINWDTIALQPSIFGSITDLQFLSSTWAYGGNRTSRLLITTNGGLNWGYQSNITASFKLSFTDTTTGWIGDNGISKTTNGGGMIIPVGVQIINSQIPSQFKLYQNYPNPFNPVTTIKVDIAKSSQVRFIILDILGKELYNETATLTAGTYEFMWDSKHYSSGIYFYRLTATNFTETKKMILIK